jgi:hypothetical protein
MGKVATGLIDPHGKCIKPFVLTVARKPKCHSNHLEKDLFIAGNVLESIKDFEIFPSHLR